MLTKKQLFLMIIAFFVNLAFVVYFKVECPWKKLFDIDCAGCGSTRMLYSIWHLDFYQAFRYNPFVFLSLVALLMYGIYIGICKLIHKNYVRIGTKTIIAYVVLLFVFMILRNISFFSYLKPTVVR